MKLVQVGNLPVGSNAIVAVETMSCRLIDCGLNSAITTCNKHLCTVVASKFFATDTVVLAAKDNSVNPGLPFRVKPDYIGTPKSFKEHYAMPNLYVGSVREAKYLVWSRPDRLVDVDVKSFVEHDKVRARKQLPTTKAEAAVPYIIAADIQVGDVLAFALAGSSDLHVITASSIEEVEDGIAVYGSTYLAQTNGMLVAAKAVHNGKYVLMPTQQVLLIKREIE